MINKKTIAIICPSRNFGGMELDSVKLAKKLNPYCNIVFITDKKSYISQNFDKYFFSNDNIKLEEVNFKSLFFINLIFVINKIFKKNEVKNIIYFGTSKLRIIYFAMIFMKINLIVRHGTTRRRTKKTFFDKLIYSKVNYHVAICGHLLENVREIFPLGKDTKLILIYTSMNIINNQRNKTKKLTILHTGRIADGKGQIDAIKACEILIYNGIDFDFFIVGGYENGYEKEFLKFYSSIKYKDKIKLVGFSNEIDKYLNNSDIFLFPSYGEGLSNSFLEALNYGLKCISYENTSFPELKKIGFDFEMVENKNIEKLKESLLKIAREEILFDIEKNKKIIETNFSEENEIKQYLELLT